ncbi:MAG: hypothetical protein HQM12_02405 [SAR324 cluster bacterium]|nr:hypothetical protein [SAR324 cluster bacterium]
MNAITTIDKESLISVSTELSGSLKSREMMIRALCNRIYQLLRRCPAKGGKNLAEVISEVELKHPQYIFDRIYKHLHNQYFMSIHERTNNLRKRAFLVQEKDMFYLKNMTDFLDVLRTLGLSTNYNEVEAQLKKQTDHKTVEFLTEDLPRSRILYNDRHVPTSYKFNVIETTEIHKTHPDGHPIPFYIKNIYIHKIFRFHGNYVKIWEFVPRKQTKPTPICLIPGFCSNYYSFHFEGNHSLDYYLVREGSRVFILDHERKDNHANIDVYTEYLCTTMIDFVRERTGKPQIILGGHSMGGMISIFKTILDAVRRPRLITSVKALLILSSPVHFSKDFFIPDSVAKFGEYLFDLIGYDGAMPVTEFLHVVFKIPMFDKLLSFNGQDFLKKLQKLPPLEFSKTLQRLIDAQINPITLNHKHLKALVAKGVTNPPRMVTHHFAKLVKSNVDGVTSYNYDEFAAPLIEVSDMDDQQTIIKDRIGINYTANLYRVSPAIPVMVIQTTDDVLSPPRSFFQHWNRWPHRYKLRIDSIPHEPGNAEETSTAVEKFIQEHGLSSAIGVTQHSGRHMGSLTTEKQLIATFIRAVENYPATPLSVIETAIDAQMLFIQREQDEEVRFIAERDFAKKIRYIDTHLFWSESRAITRILLKIICNFEPKSRIDDKFRNFMVRDTRKIEVDEEAKYNVLYNCVMTILSFKPGPEDTMKDILEVLDQMETMPPPECLRSLIDLSSGLYDLSRNGLPEKHKKFIEHFEKFLDHCAGHHQRSVALHAVRAFFHTGDELFIEKGGTYCQQWPQSLRRDAYRIYWEEARQRILELRLTSEAKLHEAMKPYMEIAKRMTSHQKSNLSDSN